MFFIMIGVGIIAVVIWMVRFSSANANIDLDNSLKSQGIDRLDFNYRDTLAIATGAGKVLINDNGRWKSYDRSQITGIDGKWRDQMAQWTVTGQRQYSDVYLEITASDLSSPFHKVEFGDDKVALDEWMARLKVFCSSP